MSDPLVLVEAEGPILVVTINRPEKKNAANAEVLCRLYDAWVRLDTDDDIRVAVLTGKGDTFWSPEKKFFLNHWTETMSK